MNLLALVLFAPLAGALLSALVPRKALWPVAVAVALAEFLLSCGLIIGFDPSGGFQQTVSLRWLPLLGLRFTLGLDGMSLALILLTTLLTFVGVLSSTRYVTTRVRSFLVLVFVMETGMLGVFSALDLFLFFVFWEAMLVPMYFLIGVWGHEGRVYAAWKFLIYTLAGSVLMAVALLYLWAQTGTLDLVALQSAAPALTAGVQSLLFLAFALSFAIKIPLFPFHTWLPFAHVEAPTAGSVLLAGVLLKMGIYGFLRIAFPLFPQAAAAYAPALTVLAVIGIIYGALMALVQPDLKKLVAYSSVAHLGFATLGISSLTVVGMQGAIVTMISHGLATGGLFLVVGMLYERRHTRELDRLAGLGKAAPVLATLFGFIVLASVGLPGTSGFVGEFLSLFGAFQSNVTAAAFGVLGVILAAVYLLPAFSKVTFRPSDEPPRPDVSTREFLVLTPLVLLIMAIGIYPRPLLTATEAVSRSVVSVVTGTAPTPPPTPTTDTEAPAHE